MDDILIAVILKTGRTELTVPNSPAHKDSGRPVKSLKYEVTFSQITVSIRTRRFFWIGDFDHPL